MRCYRGHNVPMYLRSTSDNLELSSSQLADTHVRGVIERSHGGRHREDITKRQDLVKFSTERIQLPIIQ